MLVALTLIGALLTPFFWLAAVALGAAGLCIGAYALGSWAMSYAPELSNDRVERAVTAFVGALIAALLGLIPFLGWIALVVLAVVGSGAFARYVPLVRRLAV